MRSSRNGAIAIAMAAAACAGARREEPRAPVVPSIATSGSAPPATAASSSSGLPPFAPPSFESLRLVQPAKASRGHGGGVFTIAIAATDPAAWEGTEPPPVGFMVCADHRVAATGARGPLLCMRRDGESWTYGVAERGAWTRVGALEDCKTCHATAERAPIFGPE